MVSFMLWVLNSQDASTHWIDSDAWHCVCVLDIAEESLEEISLKLIKSFLQEKTELEEQYAQVMQIFLNVYPITRHFTLVSYCRTLHGITTHKTWS
jgi:hypothetical protein